MSPSAGLTAAAAAAEQPSQGPGWGAFVGGVLLGSTVAAGAAYLAVRYASSASGGAADELRRAGKERRRPGRCVHAASFSCIACARLIRLSAGSSRCSASPSSRRPPACCCLASRSLTHPVLSTTPRRAAFSRARVETAGPVASRSRAPIPTCTTRMGWKMSCWRWTAWLHPPPASRR